MDSHELTKRRFTTAELGRRFPDLILDENSCASRIITYTPVQRAALLLQRNIWTIVACTLIATSMCLLYAARQPRLYCATAKIAIYRDNQPTVSLGKEYAQEVGDLDEYAVSVETQLHILQSRRLARGIVQKLKLDQDPEFSGNPRTVNIPTSENDGAPTVSKAESVAADAVLLGLAVRQVKDTRVVEVSFTGSRPDMNAKIANAVVDGFIEDSIRSRYESATRAATFLTSQLTDLRNKVEESQERLVKYERDHDIVGVDEKQNVVTTKLDDLNKQLTLAQGERIEKESLYQTIVAGSLDQAPDKAGEALQSLRLREAELKNEYAQASTTDGPNHPRVLELTNRIKAMDASIQAELKRLRGMAYEEYRASVKREQKLQAAFNSQKIEANRLSESAIQYGLLKREVDSNRQLYDSLQERVKEAGVVAGLHSSNIRLIDSADAPRSPVSPNLPRSGSIGLFLGFLTSAAAIGLREGMNRILRDPAEVESFTAMPSLAVVPLRASAKHILGGSDRDTIDAVCLSQPRSAMAEAYRALGTSIMLASPRPQTLLVTSPLPGEGKTLTALNTAVVLAQQGNRVLLVDADLRKPTLHRGLNLANEFGLSSVLLDSSNITRCIASHEGLPNLFALSAGPAQSMAAELLGSQKMRELMCAWREQYDYIIIDTPPALAVTDAMRLSSDADSLLLVMRSGQTTREALARSCDLLNQAKVPVLGIVVNGVDVRSGSYYYGYYPELTKSYYHDERSRS